MKNNISSILLTASQPGHNSLKNGSVIILVWHYNYELATYLAM